MAENTTDLKVEIKGLKKDIESSNRLNERLDTAIEKLTDVSTSIKSMLAVHEEKISRQEQIDEIIFDKLKERAGEIDTVHRELSKEIQASTCLYYTHSSANNCILSRHIYTDAEFI